MISLITRSIRLGKILLKRRSLLSRVKFVHKTRDEFRKAITELKIPKAIEPELVFIEVPGAYGGYNAKLNWVAINQYVPRLSRFWHRLRYGSTVRHEVKHSQQFLEIAGRGLNDKLNKACQLNSEVAKRAEGIFKSRRAGLEARVDLAQKSLEASTNATKTLFDYHSTIMTLSRSLRGNFQKFFRRKKIQRPASTSIQTGHYTLGGKNFSAEQLRDLVNPPKTLSQAWQEVKQARRVHKQAYSSYWDDTFEREARDFAVANRFSPSRLLKDLRKSLYII